MDPFWWRHYFDDVYLATEARTVDDPVSTADEADFAIRALDMEPGHAVLDLCGGQGRHALELCRRGYGPVAVLDYSEAMTRQGSSAARRERARAAFCRGDARALGLRDRSFDRVLVMGNSFGYFQDDKENAKILGEIRRVLKPGGRLLLDLTNREYAARVAPASCCRDVDQDLRVHLERSVRGQAILAAETVFSRTRGLVRRAEYSMRLFTPDEIAGLLEANGFREARFAPDPLSRPRPMDQGVPPRRMLVTASAAR